MTNSTAQKMEFSIKVFFSKCDQFLADLVTFTEEILNGKLHFLCSVGSIPSHDCGRMTFHENTFWCTTSYLKC